jgi:anti-sigma regulatory factor (Ser/Thr protein kinase)
MRHKKVKDLIFAQNEELEKADKEKMLFFRFVSHELKSPIIAVQSAINVVLDVMDINIKPKARDMLERGRKRTVQMIEILKDLVSLSYEEKDEKHEPELVVPCEHIPEVIDYYRPIAEEKNIQLIETVCKQRKGFQLDKFVFEKIITNLLSNAVRYTPNGGTVTIKTDLDDNFWYLMISDTGIGIPKEEQKQIFKEFYRAGNAKKFEAVGTGLGMSIIKKMVEQENGEVFVESEVGKGSTFTVILQAKNYTMLKIVGVPNKPGLAGQILTEFGRANINLHFIAEGEDAQGFANMTICIYPKDAKEAVEIIKSQKNGSKTQSVEEIPNIASLTVYGPHFREKPAISGEMCSVLGKADVNILGISTSISSICCLIKDEDFDRAYDALLSVFKLP